MAVTLKDSASAAAVAALRPLVDLLLELGVSSPEAESLLRSVYVHAAKDKVESSGEKPTFARIGLLTGIHRNEVADKLRSRPRIDPEREARTYGANRVLSGWHKDARYRKANGQPRVLPLSGEGSFEELVQSYAPNISPSVVLDELERVKAAERLQDDEVRARAESFAPPGLDASGLEELGIRAKDYLSTLAHNLLKPGQAYLSETAISLEVAPKAIPLLLRTIRERSMFYISEIESEMNDPRLRRDPTAGDGRVRMGVSLFYFEEELTPPKGAKPPRAHRGSGNGRLDKPRATGRGAQADLKAKAPKG